MRTVLAVGLVAALMCFAARSLTAQSLSDQLKAEPPDRLGEDARRDGDAIRGSVLFNQRGVACGRCHVSGVSDLLGPDLTKIADEETDRDLVESILNPSKDIKEGFETATLVTLDGRVITGRLISDSSDQIVVRENSPDGALHSLAKEDLEETTFSQTSMMPDDLIDQLRNRQQFLDVVRYVMQVRESDITVSENRDGHGVLAPHLQGLALVDQLNCLACHSAEQLALEPRQSFGPDLRYVSGRIDPHYVERFIAEPHVTKPGTRMPDLLKQLDVEERAQSAEELTHYILSLSEGEFSRQSVDASAAERGRVLYHSVGCVACHAPYDDQGEPRYSDSFATIGRVEAKYNLDGLTALIEEPHTSRPSGRMPDLQLTHWEAIDIASYLLSRTAEDSTQPGVSAYEVIPSMAQAGKEKFVDLGCVQCHETPDTSATRSFPNLSHETSQSGCLSTEPSSVPVFSISDRQREAIQAALGKTYEDLTPEDRIGVSMTSLNCVACHARGEIGGVSLRIDEFFQTTDQNLGQQGRIPPSLTGVGSKLQKAWMREVLVSGRSIRPYMLTRMPQFGAHNVEALIDWIYVADPPASSTSVAFEDQKVMRDAGLEMVGSQGLNCIACHTYRYEKSETMPSVDLTEMAQRLDRDWFHQYMRDPQRFSHNTVMPSFWPGGASVRQDILDGDADLQVEALWQYLLDGRDARAPRGVVREPIEIVASDEAVMLRRSYRGVGKRGIGVGFASESNLVFDAEQMRLASIWKGGFAEASGVWRGQGSGQVRPLGRDLISFGAGPEIDHATEPWMVDDGRPPQHRFEGYYLDDQRRPTFMYRFDDVSIEDYTVDVPADQSESRVLRRSISLSCPEDRTDIAFRIVTADRVELVGDQEFSIGDHLVVRIISAHTMDLIEQEEERRIVIPLELQQGVTELILEYEF